MLHKPHDPASHPPFYVYFGASTLSAVFENIGFFPVDTIKARLQCAMTSKKLCSKNALPDVKSIVLPNAHTFHGARASLYQGFWANIFYRIFQRNTMFAVQPIINNILHEKIGKAMQQHFGKKFVEPLLGALAGVTSSLIEILGLPLSTITIRMQTQHCTATKAMMQRGLYNGSRITFARNTLVAAPVLYGTSSYILDQFHLENAEDASMKQNIIASVIGGTLSTLVSHPLDTIKTQMQASKLTRSELAVANAIWTQNGFRGFLRGIIPRVLVAAPRTTFAMTTTKQFVKTAKHYSEHGFFTQKKTDVQKMQVVIPDQKTPTLTQSETRPPL